VTQAVRVESVLELPGAVAGSWQSLAYSHAAVVKALFGTAVGRLSASLDFSYN
jgi:hypothetical protein